MVANVEFLVDGALVTSQAAGPFVFALPSTAAGGAVTLEARATDSAGNVGSAQVTVTIAADGGEGNLGELCLDSAECDSRVCATLDGEMRCSRECSETSACPPGFECLGGTACWPESGGGCAASGGPGSSGALAVLGLLGVLALGRRRRR
jgi:MYXO-CTERM domain-containing protein